MRVMISAEGNNTDSTGTKLHHMIVDNRGVLLDLTHVPGGTLVDPTISKVEWGPIVVNGEMQEGGAIYQVDGGRRTFWDRNLLTPYLGAFENARKESARAQAEYDAAQEQAAIAIAAANKHF